MNCGVGLYDEVVFHVLIRSKSGVGKISMSIFSKVEGILNVLFHKSG